LFTSDLKQAIEASCDGIGQRLIDQSGQGGGVSRRDVVANERRDDNARIPGLRCGQYGEKSELLPVGKAAPLDRDRAENRETVVERLIPAR
jgi:hypothetical protein